MVQNDKKFCSSHSISQEPYIIWLSFVVHMCKMIISLDILFIFFKIFIFCVVKGVNRQKTVQNDKKFSLSCSISQERYIIWFSFIVHMSKIIISPGVFFIFSKFWFFGLLGGVKMQKKVQNDKKVCLPHSISQEPYIIWLSFMVHMCKLIISSVFFFIFQNFDFLGP